MNIDNIDFLHRNQYGHDALYACFMKKTKDEEEIKDKKIYLEKILSFSSKFFPKKPKILF